MIAAKPIDVLILETALRDGSISERPIAGLWGANIATVGALMRRLENRGLLMWSGAVGAYIAAEEPIREYLASRRQAIQ